MACLYVVLLSLKMSDLERFVSDRLHNLIGMSDKLIVQYFIGLASKSDSVGLFLQKLKETDTVVIDEKMKAFAEEVWRKVIDMFDFIYIFCKLVCYFIHFFCMTPAPRSAN